MARTSLHPPKLVLLVKDPPESALTRRTHTTTNWDEIIETCKDNPQKWVLALHYQNHTYAITQASRIRTGAAKQFLPAINWEAAHDAGDLYVRYSPVPVQDQDINDQDTLDRPRKKKKHKRATPMDIDLDTDIDEED